ncbi:MAG: iron-sulfur cluster assembly accessory protein [Thiogranum sp.]|nr:iron-sulfur cluster assembly accessory protein [Thiogranum sp.]
MAVALTENAAKHVASMLQKRGSGIGLRLGTRKSGCSGFAYVVDYADAVGDNDTVFESHGVRIVVDRDSLEQLEGIEVDYLKSNAINQGFEFRNPNVKDTCGCGESFSV